MALRSETLDKIMAAREVLEQDSPMTLRQVFYQLVSKQVIENTDAAYRALSRNLRDARLQGIIPWEWIEDRLRQPRAVSMFDGLQEFARYVPRWYRRNVWLDQPVYIEACLEKDALSGIFEDVLEEYGVTLNVARGYDGWSSINNIANSLARGWKLKSRRTLLNQPVWRDRIILYFGDFDPSGEDMVQSLKKRLNELRTYPEIIKCAIQKQDIQQFGLPPNPTKTSDTRSRKFIEKHGDETVELDALPISELRHRIKHEIESRMDMQALQATLDREEADRDRLQEALTDLDEE